MNSIAVHVQSFRKKTTLVLVSRSGPASHMRVMLLRLRHEVQNHFANILHHTRPRGAVIKSQALQFQLNAEKRPCTPSYDA